VIQFANIRHFCGKIQSACAGSSVIKFVYKSTEDEEEANSSTVRNTVVSALSGLIQFRK